jgi:hypothetical protein
MRDRLMPDLKRTLINPIRAAGAGPASARRRPVNGGLLRQFNVGPGSAIFGRWPTLSHGRSNVGSAQATDLRSQIMLVVPSGFAVIRKILRQTSYE